MEKLKGELSNIELERQARLETLSTNRAALWSQIIRIRETIRLLLHEDKTLAEQIRSLFREEGIMIGSILTAISMAISTLVLAVTGGGAGGTPSLAPISHPTWAGSRSGLKSTYRPLGVPWPIWPARPLRPCLESSGPLSLGS